MKTRIRSFDLGASQLASVSSSKSIDIQNSLECYAICGSRLSYAPIFLPSMTEGELVDCSDEADSLTFDSAAQRVRVSGGTRLRKLFGYLYERGFFLPVQPGHPDITIGGCVASCVHGKNQYRDGTIENWIDELTLFHPVHGVLVCSRSYNKDVFELTIGGLGITGFIMSVVLRVQSLSHLYTVNRTIKCPNVGEMAANLQSMLLDKTTDYAYGIVDLNNNNKITGYIVCSTADANACNQFDIKVWANKPPYKRSVPLIFNLYTRATSSIALKYLEFRSNRRLNFAQSCFPAEDSMVYYSLYGFKGFVERQFIIPESNFESILFDIWKQCIDLKIAVPLFTVKIFRQATQGKRYLKYDSTGVCLALDIPRSSYRKSFESFLDDLIVRYGGRTCIYKYSSSNLSMISQEYGSDCIEYLNAWDSYDKKRIFKSKLLYDIFK